MLLSRKLLFRKPLLFFLTIGGLIAVYAVVRLLLFKRMVAVVLLLLWTVVVVPLLGLSMHVVERMVMCMMVAVAQVFGRVDDKVADDDGDIGSEHDVGKELSDDGGGILVQQQPLGVPSKVSRAQCW